MKQKEVLTYSDAEYAGNDDTGGEEDVELLVGNVVVDWLCRPLPDGGKLCRQLVDHRVEAGQDVGTVFGGLLRLSLIAVVTGRQLPRKEVVFAGPDPGLRRGPDRVVPVIVVSGLDHRDAVADYAVL